MFAYSPRFSLILSPFSPFFPGGWFFSSILQWPATYWHVHLRAHNELWPPTNWALHHQNGKKQATKATNILKSRDKLETARQYSLALFSLQNEYCITKTQNQFKISEIILWAHDNTILQLGNIDGLLSPICYEFHINFYIKSHQNASHNEIQDGILKAKKITNPPRFVFLSKCALTYCFCNRQQNARETSSKISCV